MVTIVWWGSSENTLQTYSQQKEREQTHMCALLKVQWRAGPLARVPIRRSQETRLTQASVSEGEDTCFFSQLTLTVVECS